MKKRKRGLLFAGHRLMNGLDNSKIELPYGTFYKHLKLTKIEV